MDGTPFGRYRLIEMLGQGGMGEVWRAFDTDTQRIVAVKVLPAHLATDPAFEQRFRREAYAAAGLSEPHIVPIHSFGEIDGRLYVDMRLVDGRDLDTVLRDGPLDPARAVRVIEQVASALHAAHRIGLVHRDVKPSNILLAEDDFAYLIDFGIARAAGETGLTSAGATIGTWAYMAPERFTTGIADARADVYALACVLHQTLTGYQPFPGETLEQQVAGHLTSPPPRPSVNRPWLSLDMDSVIAAGMAKNADHRFPSTIELARAAHTAVANPATRAAPLPRPMTAPMPAPTPAARTSVPTAAIPVAAPSISAAPTQQHQPPPPAPPPPPPRPWATPGARPPRPKWRSPVLLIPVLLLVIAVVATTIVLVTRGSASETSASPSSNGAPPPSATRPKGPLEGTFSAEFGTRTTLSGRPYGDPPGGRQTWEFGSVCRPTGCVATAIRVDGTSTGSANLVFDDLDGRWLAVSTSSGTCKGANSEVWEVFSLRPLPDGTLKGEYITWFPSGGCADKYDVTFAPRSGEPSVAVADPSAQVARVGSPALALNGRYRFDLDGKDREVRTYCPRTGGRCATYATSVETGASYYLFEADKWNRSNTSFDADCQGAGRQHIEVREQLSLPQPPQDPIQELTGSGHLTATGTPGKCDVDKDLVIKWTRVP